MQHNGNKFQKLAIYSVPYVYQKQISASTYSRRRKYILNLQGEKRDIWKENHHFFLISQLFIVKDLIIYHVPSLTLPEMSLEENLY